MLFRIVFISLLLLMLAACSQDPPGVTLESGSYSVRISSDPDPLEVGERAQFTLQVRDRENAAVGDCNVRLLQTMPGMEMSTDDVYVVLTPTGSGRYQGTSHEFHMGGDWVLEFELACGGEEARTLTLERHLEWPE